ncbi:hypothetical protein Goarm_011130 [Gossypium armourianum]|uniref:Uncharacterized protein n=1 Tax=Gossypium armourianum TaxID=34283 RepID=A0A7J9IVW1_9ROSI|nr:hypothetical protein [Gossypium armourianum]
MGLPIDTVKARLKDKNGACISWSDIRDAMGKASGDRRFLGCAQLLFVWMKSHFRCLYKHFCQVFVPSTRPIEEFLESEWPPNQSIQEWVQNLRSISYSSLMVLS